MEPDERHLLETPQKKRTSGTHGDRHGKDQAQPFHGHDDMSHDTLNEMTQRNHRRNPEVAAGRPITALAIARERGEMRDLGMTRLYETGIISPARAVRFPENSGGRNPLPW
jgi:hypothetical protein